MRRWARRLPLVVLALTAGLIPGKAGDRDRHAPAPAVLVFSAHEQAVLLSYPSGRAHPEGPDEDERPTRARALYSATAATTWTGGRRHPQWRGCRHVYDRKLSAFIFSSSAPSR
jgi:hypothetical protein